MKKTTKIASALLISTFVLGAASPVFADQVAAPITDATVKFKAEAADADSGGNTMDPTNPDGNGVKPDTGTGSVGTKGPLRVDFAPNFNFSEVTMSGNAKDYHPLYPKVSVLDATGKVTDPLIEKRVPHYVQVTDNRGTNEGWELTVSATAFRGTKNQEADLKATLTLGYAELASAVKPIEGNDFKPTLFSKATVLSDTPEKIMEAKADKGMGSWSAVFSKDKETDFGFGALDINPNITLSVPADSKKDPNEEYKSTITWTLSTTPTTPPVK
ncbi:WxL domain-containing protein [Enterococcus rotai]|uniref:WxL domain-containing protein n=1 Tax=Enterococcus rotai TaxID=118060 RepID=UPI0035C77BBC